tara:strand:+ start:1083 stop:1424 length:342 start_codon:yes stop_codon:yes gene_type:complete
LNNIIAAIILFTIGQAMIWFQTNGQFVWPWAKENPILMALIGFPISYILIIATKYVVAGFDGLLWPGRLVGFGTGMIVMAILTYCYMGEGITTKTLISLVLATTLVFIQVFWK